MHPVLFIVFLPLLAAIVAGLGGRWIGKTAAKVVTTGALFIGAFLSWPIFFQYIAGTRQPAVVPVLDWIQSGTLTVDWALRVDSLTAVMLVVVTTVSSLVHLYSWGYMEEDPSQPRFFAYLSLFSFAMLMLVTADSLVQMFFGWEGVGLASYLLIGFWYYKPTRERGGAQGVRRQPRRRFRLLARHLRHVPGVRHGLDPGDPRRGAGHGGIDHRLCRHAREHDDRALPAAVRRRDGQVGAASAAHLASRRDGGPDAGQRPDPRRDDGHGRRVHGLPPVADVRSQRDRDGRRHLRRRRDLHLRRDGRLRPERHQARDRLFDLLAARLHVLRRGRRGIRRGDVPPVHPRLLQGACCSSARAA